MSELTQCNFCKLKQIRARAAGGARTYVRNGRGEWEGWKVVTQSGRSKPVAYFRDLTNHCVC